MTEKESFRGGGSGTELAAPRSQPNKGKKDWQRGESETGPDELLKQWNKGKHVCNPNLLNKGAAKKAKDSRQS